MKRLLLLFLIFNLFKQFCFAQNEQPQNTIFLSKEKPDTNQVFSLSSFQCLFNKYDISTFNDTASAHLADDTLSTTVADLSGGLSFKVNKNEYAEIWWKIYVDTSMANKIIGFDFNNEGVTSVFWDNNLVLSLGKLDLLHNVSEPNKINVNVFPVSTGTPGWHNFIVRQKSEDYLLDDHTFQNAYFVLYRNYNTHLVKYNENEQGFERTLREGFRFFLLCVFIVSVLFYLIVQKTKSFFWFSAFSFCVLIVYFRDLIYWKNSFYILFATPVFISFLLFSLVAFAFETFLGKIPKRIYWYFASFLIILIVSTIINSLRISNEHSFLQKMVGYGLSLLICVVGIEVLIKIIHAIKIKKKRIKIIAFGTLPYFIIFPLLLFVPQSRKPFFGLLTIYLLPVSFLAALIYIIKDSFTENIVKQTEILALTQANEKILEEQNLILEEQVKQRTSEVVKQKELVEELLLNILPSEVAEELKQKGTAEAKQFDDVTVMFTDFKNFTQISEKLTPSELVSEIHTCFKAFDDIISKHNIEKIKTIGDSYMCAGGLPVANKTNATDVVNAALEIQQFVKEHAEKRKTEGKELFEIRIGVHTGAVVAGIVGVKKFAYDIWGDTVNIASRMESSGEAGKVNISGTTYELVKEKVKCNYRGKIQAKNKGEIDMYFVEGVS